MENMIGKKVRVLTNAGGNKFKIGEIVELVDMEDGVYKAKNKDGAMWYLSDTQFKLIEETPTDAKITISRRDYFAAAALQGMIARYGTDYQTQHAREAAYMADELIKELDKE